MNTRDLDELIWFADSLGGNDADAIVMSPQTAIEIFETTFVTEYRGWQILILEGQHAAITITNKKKFLETYRVYFPADRYPTTEGGPSQKGQPGLESSDRAHQDLQDQDRALAAAREILSQGTDLQAAPRKATAMRDQTVVKHMEEIDRDARKAVMLLVMILALVAMLASGCSTASSKNERVTVDYQLTTGDHGQGTWILPSDARVFVRTGRGYTGLDWEAGGPVGVQKEGGTLKSNVVDFTVLRRSPTRETRNSEDISGGTVVLLVLGFILGFVLLLPVLIYAADRINLDNTIGRWAEFVWNTLDRWTGHKRN